MISVLQLGTIDYATGLRLQEKLVELRKENSVSDVLLLLEHTPVITLGRNAKAVNVVVSAQELAKRGVEVFESDRGGDVTFHGPGQLVGYPIFDLHSFTSSDGRRKTLGVIEYVRRLEEVLIRTCADFAIPAERVAGLTGVWTSTTQAALVPEPGRDTHIRAGREQAKIAAIGVHISRGVTSHGFALNVNTDLSYFDLIVPCGIASKPVTSMARESGKTYSLDEVAQSISRNFGAVFASQIRWQETLDALTQQLGVPMKPPAELRRLHNEEERFWG